MQNIDLLTISNLAAGTLEILLLFVHRTPLRCDDMPWPTVGIHEWIGRERSASDEEGRHVACVFRSLCSPETDSMIAWLDDCDRDAQNHANRR